MTTSRIVAALLSLVLVACGGDDTSNNPSGPATDAGSGTDAASLDGGSTEDASSTDAGGDRDQGDQGGIDLGPGEPNLDRDGDGVSDDRDAFPDDPSEWLDSDGDGVGNAAQVDEDGDGVPDEEDAFPFDPTTSEITPVTHPNDGSIPVLMGAPPYRVVFQTGSSSGTYVGGQTNEVQLTVDATTTFLIRVDSPADEIDIYVREARGSYSQSAEVIELDGVAVATWRPYEPGDYKILTFVDGEEAIDVDLVIRQDSDGDGLADELERALGMRFDRTDPDRDGISDFTEYRLAGLADPDGDGLRAWYDPDQDGDSILDAVEGFEDADADGIPNLMDTDSDGNGINDADERGVIDELAWDIDADDIPNFLDLDDDGDAILDARDPDPATPAALSPGLGEEPPVFTSESNGSFAGGTVEVPGATRTGEPLEINGSGFAPASNPFVVIEYDDGRVENLTPSAASSTTLTITPEQVGSGTLFVVQGSVITDSLDVDVLHPDAPVLYPPAEQSQEAFSGSYIIPGEKIERGALILTGEEFIDARYSTLYSGLELRGVKATVVQAEVDSRLSNRLQIRPVVDYQIAANVPSGAVFGISDLTLLASANGGDDTPAFTNVFDVQGEVLNTSVVAATVAGVDRPKVVMYTTVHSVPFGPTGSQMSTLTTAATWVMETNFARSRLDSEKHLEAWNAVLALPEVIALGSAIETAAQTSDDYLENPPAAVQTAFDAAVETAESEIAAREVVVQPLITDAIISPGEQSDVLVVQREGTGDLRLENDTSLYLSTELRGATGGMIVPHAQSPFDLAMVQPQRGPLLLFDARLANIAGPNYRNAVLEVVTPGFAQPMPTAPSSIDAQVYVFLRTALDRIIFPMISMALDAKFKTSKLLPILLSQNWDLVQDVRVAVADGDLLAAATLVVEAVKRDIDAFGPLTQYMLKTAFRDVSSDIAKKFLAKLVPVLGQVESLLDAISAANTATQIGKTAVDLLTTPAMLTWQVDFGLEITETEPPRLERAHRKQRLCLAGSGFRDSDGAPAELDVIDTDTSFRPSVTNIVISADGGSYCFDIAARDAARLVGPLQADLSRSDTAEQVSTLVTVRNDFELLRIVDYNGQLRGREKLQGTGFGDVAALLEVRFKSPDTGNVVATAAVLEANHTELTFEMPPLEVGQAYDMLVARGPVDSRMESNIIAINPEFFSPVGRWNVTWQVTHRYPECFGADTGLQTDSGAMAADVTLGSPGIMEFLTRWLDRGPGLEPGCTYSVSRSGAMPWETGYGTYFGDGSGIFCATNYGPFDLLPTTPWDWQGYVRNKKVRYIVAGDVADSCLAFVHRVDAVFRPAP